MLIEPLRGLFRTMPLNGSEWAMAVAFSLVPFAAYETLKLIRRAYHRRHPVPADL